MFTICASFYNKWKESSVGVVVVAVSEIFGSDSNQNRPEQYLKETDPCSKHRISVNIEI